MIDMEVYNKKHPVVLAALAVITAYSLLGLMFYSGACGWSLINSLYFSVITLTTVGYGDLLPGTSTSKLFTSFYALIGVFLIGLLLGVVMNALFDHEKTFLNDLDSEVETDSSGNRRAPSRQKEYKALLREIAVAVFCTVVVLLVGTLVYVYVEGLSLMNAFYLSCITVATVGYGDLAPQTPAGRLFTTFYVLVGTGTVGNVLQNVAAIPIEMRHRQLRRDILHQFGATLERDELISLTKGGAVPDICTKAEFILGMLVKMDIVKHHSIRDCEAQFDRFDVTGDGVLTEADLSPEVGNTRTAVPIGHELHTAYKQYFVTERALVLEMQKASRNPREAVSIDEVTDARIELERLKVETMAACAELVENAKRLSDKLVREVEASARKRAVSLGQATNHDDFGASELMMASKSWSPPVKTPTPTTQSAEAWSPPDEMSRTVAGDPAPD